jgi:hypothetical protein
VQSGNKRGTGGGESEWEEEELEGNESTARFKLLGLPRVLKRLGHTVERVDKLNTAKIRVGAVHECEPLQTPRSLPWVGSDVLSLPHAGQQPRRAATPRNRLQRP